MRRIAVAVFLVLFLCGCTNRNAPMDKILGLRTQITDSTEVSFDAIVTADYADEIHIFGMDCVMNDQGDLSFCIASPQTIEGITGNILSDGGHLTFDDEVLAFEPLADDLITPVGAPWILMKTLRSGYIKACSSESGGTLAIINDSYADNALQLNVWIDDSGVPSFAEILWNNYRFISIEIDDFCIV